MNSGDEAILFATMQGLDIGIVVLDPGGLVSHVNAAAVLHAGVTPDEWLGRPLPLDAPGWLSEQGREELRLALLERRPLRVCGQSPRGESVLETTLHPGKAGSMICVGEEVRTSAEARLKHDLMQPLGSIGNYAELIRMQGEAATQRHALEIGRIVAALAARIRRSAQ